VTGAHDDEDDLLRRLTALLGPAAWLALGPAGPAQAAQFSALARPRDALARVRAEFPELEAIGRAGSAVEAALLVAQARLFRGDLLTAAVTLDGVVAALPAEHPQRDEVVRLRDQVRARLARGSAPRAREEVLAPGYLLMAAQDGELTAEEAAALEDRVASADPAADAAMQVEARWHERVRGSLARLQVAPGDEADLSKLRERVKGRLEAPAGVETSTGPTKVSLDELDRKGFRRVKVLRAGDVKELVSRTVERALREHGVVQRDVDPAALAGAAADAVAAFEDLRGGAPPWDARASDVRHLGLEVVTRHVAAPENGTDWVDVVERSTGLDVVLGDVSGRGAPAEQAAAVTRGALRAALDLAPGTAEVLLAANRAACALAARGTFSAVGLARCEGATGRVRLGGLVEVVLVRRAATGRVEPVRLRGLVLGALATVTAGMTGAADVTLAPGDLLVLCSDGVTEAKDPEGALLDAAALAALVEARGGGSAGALVDALVEEVRRHVGGGALEDDAVVVAVRRG
jgi:hypothetical protein